MITVLFLIFLNFIIFSYFTLIGEWNVRINNMIAQIGKKIQIGFKNHGLGFASQKHQAQGLSSQIPKDHRQ